MNHVCRHEASSDAGRERMSRKHVSSAKDMSRVREIVFVFLFCLMQLLNQASLGQTLRFVFLCNAGWLETRQGTKFTTSIIHIIGDSFSITEPAELSWLIAA